MTSIRRLIIGLLLTIAFVFIPEKTFALGVLDWDSAGLAWWTGQSIPVTISGTTRDWFYTKVDVGRDGWLTDVMFRLKQNSGGCSTDKHFRIVIRKYVSGTDFGYLIGQSDEYQCNELPTYATSPVPLSDFQVEGLWLDALYLNEGDTIWVGLQFEDGTVGLSQNILMGLKDEATHTQLNCTDTTCSVYQYTENFYPQEIRTYIDSDLDPPVTPDIESLTSCLPYNYIGTGSSGDYGIVETILRDSYIYLTNTPLVGDMMFLSCVLYNDFYSNLGTETTTDLTYHITAFNLDQDFTMSLTGLKSNLEDWVSGITGFSTFKTLLTSVLWAILLFSIFFTFIFPELSRHSQDQLMDDDVDDFRNNSVSRLHFTKMKDISPTNDELL